MEDVWHCICIVFKGEKTTTLLSKLLYLLLEKFFKHWNLVGSFKHFRQVLLSETLVIILQYLAVVSDSFSKGAHEIPQWWLVTAFSSPCKKVPSQHTLWFWLGMCLAFTCLSFILLCETSFYSNCMCQWFWMPGKSNTLWCKHWSHLTWMWYKHVKQCLMNMGKNLYRIFQHFKEKKILLLPLDFIFGFCKCLLLEWEGYKCKGCMLQMW